MNVTASSGFSMVKGVRSSILFLIFVAGCSPTRGCIESNFELAPESRLPKWLASAGLSRQDATVTMDYWSGPFGGTATLTLRDKNGHRAARVAGRVRDNEPTSLVPPTPENPHRYPMYEVITANGITEVIEHRRMEPIFYITDDPKVKEQLGVRDRK